MKSVQRSLLCLISTAAALGVAGCSLSNSGVTATPGAALRGRVHGGQQPVAGATIQLYAVGTNGYGSAARAMIASTIKTGADGTFDIDNSYTCNTGDQVYIVATGGNPGVSGTHHNSALALMAGLGPCDYLVGGPGGTYIEINELTTVASVWPLAPFMKDISHVGSTATNVLGITNAFNTITLKLANTSTGTVPSAFLNTAATAPIAEINTLADILASCINSVNTASNALSAGCTSLFAAATPPNGAAPADTVQAALNIALNPTLNVATLNGLSGGTGSPFQPTLGSTAPSSWTIALNYSATAVDTTPNVFKGLAIDPGGYVYAVGAGSNPDTSHTNTLFEISPLTGSVIETHYTGNTIENQPSAIAIDPLGNLWVTDSANNSVVETGPTAPIGGGGIITGGGLNAPNAVAIDAAGNVWISNGGDNSVSEFTSAGVPVGSGFSGSGDIVNPVAIAIDPQ